MQNNFLQLSLNKLNLSNIFFINLFLILGIIYQKNNLNFLFIFFLFFASFLFFFFKNTQTSFKFILYLLFFSLGIVLYKNQQYAFYKFVDAYSKKEFDAIVIIKDIFISTSSKQQLIINIEKINNSGSWEYINKNAKLILPKDSSINNLQVSDKIQVRNLFFKSPNIFLKDNLIKEELVAYITTNNFSQKLIERPTFSLNRIFKNLRNRVFSNLQSKINKNTFSLFSSVFLGNKNIEKHILSKHKKKFNRWGLAHYLARSGLHLVIIFLAWFLIISILPISFYLKQVIILCIICVYSLLSWESIPFIRAMITFILYKICVLLDFQINPLHCLNLACFIMLLLNPIQLFFLDFQLSFILTFSIIWINSFNIK